MGHESQQGNNNNNDDNYNPSTPDNIEQRITSMLEDVLKGDSSDEELKKKMSKNPKQSANNFKPMICLNDMPVSEDIYVIKDPNEFNFFGNNSNKNFNNKKLIKKNNTLDFSVNSNNAFFPKNLKNNNLDINNNVEQMPKQSQNLKLKANLNLGNSIGNNNTLSFNGLGGNFNLSPHMEKRKDKNLAIGLNATHLKENNLGLGNSNTLNNFFVPGIANKNTLSIPVNLNLSL